jgi:hypothetical protein
MADEPTEANFILRLDRADKKAKQELKTRAKVYATILTGLSTNIDAQDKRRGVSIKYKEDVGKNVGRGQKGKKGALSVRELTKKIISDRDLFNRLNAIFTDDGKLNNIAQSRNDDRQIEAAAQSNLNAQRTQRLSSVIRSFRTPLAIQQLQNITAAELPQGPEEAIAIVEEKAPVRAQDIEVLTERMPVRQSDLDEMKAFDQGTKDSMRQALTNAGFVKSAIEKLVRIVSNPSNLKKLIKDMKGPALVRVIAATGAVMASDRTNIKQRARDLATFMAFLQRKAISKDIDPKTIKMDIAGRKKDYLRKIGKEEPKEPVELPGAEDKPRERRRRQPKQRRPDIKPAPEVREKAAELQRARIEELKAKKPTVAEETAQLTEQARDLLSPEGKQTLSQITREAKERPPSFSDFMDKAQRFALRNGKVILVGGISYLIGLYRQTYGIEPAQTEIDSATETAIRIREETRQGRDAQVVDRPVQEGKNAIRAEPSPVSEPPSEPPNEPPVQPPGQDRDSPFEPVAIDDPTEPPTEPPKKKDEDRETSRISNQEQEEIEESNTAVSSLKPKFISPSVELLDNTQPVADFNQFNAFGFVPPGSEGDGIVPADNPLKMINMINQQLRDSGNLVEYTKKFGMNTSETIQFQQELVQNRILDPPKEKFTPFNPDTLFKSDSIFNNGVVVNPSYKDAYYAFSDIDALNTEIASSNLYGRDL